MDAQAIFGLQFAMNIIMWGLLAYWLLTPWLAKKLPNEALFFLVLPHAFRHMGMVFLVSGVVAQKLPDNFAGPAAYGDLLAGLLAILALIALRNNWSAARALVWIFNIIGFVDLLNALRHLNVVPNFGATWFIPTLYVPLLIVTHIMIFYWLLKNSVKRGA